jgi:hypothetical protein
MVRGFQIRLSDVLLIVAVPAAAAILINAAGWSRFEPQNVYVVAVVVSLPGAALGLFHVRLMGYDPGERVLSLSVRLVFSIALGFALAVPLDAQLCKDRMASNQTRAANLCKVFADAEEIYRRADHDGDGILEYAQSLQELASVPKKGDGLIEQSFADAEGLPGEAIPKCGYVFKVLTSQGQYATGGARSYIAAGNMTLGYALMACPAEYDVTGRDTFYISNNGTIFQKDHGPNTAKMMKEIDAFGWEKEPWGCSE